MDDVVCAAVTILVQIDVNYGLSICLTRDIDRTEEHIMETCHFQALLRKANTVCFMEWSI